MKQQTHIPLKKRKKMFIEDLRFGEWEADINYRGLQEILPEMQNAKEMLQGRIDAERNFIKEMEADPTYEARQKRKAAEERIKGLEQKLKQQQEQIDKTLEAAEKYEKTMQNLGIYIRIARQMK